MTTKVYHYRNSFLEVINNDLRLLMDPWINPGNLDSWAGCKAHNFLFNSINKNPVDYIYISHLHSDHFDLKFLKTLKKKQKKQFKIIVKKFKDHRLRNKLIENNTFKKGDIIELDEYISYDLKKKNFLTILPQKSASNTESIYINYDLDTSCVFTNKDVQLYNQVDNPYSPKDLGEILNILKKKNLKNDFDISFIPYCAASEYPQAYINLNRNKEKKIIIKSRLKKFYNLSKKINTKYVVPAGGTYKLGLFYSKLNKYLAVPTNKEILDQYKKLDKKNYAKILDSENLSFEFNNHIMRMKKTTYKKEFKSFINKKGKDPLDTLIKNKFNKNIIKKKLNAVEKNLLGFKLNLHEKLNSNINFIIYDKQPLKISKISNYSNKVKHQVLEKNHKKSKILLNVHMYYKVVECLINGSVSWNEMQSLCLFERKPNKYDPDSHFWLNLYKL